MMYSEFVERTNIEVSNEEYGFIEESYYEFEGNKDEFCKAWLKAKKNGMWEMELKFRKRMSDMNAAHKVEIEEIKKNLDNYKEAFEVTSQKAIVNKEKADKLQVELYEANKKAQESIELQEDCNELNKRIESLAEEKRIANETATKLWEDFRTQEDRANALEQEVIKLKAKLYDLICK